MSVQYKSIDKDLITRYYQKQLTANEYKAFVAKMKSDASFTEEVMIHHQLMHGLKSAKKKKLSKINNKAARITRIRKLVFSRAAIIFVPLIFTAAAFGIYLNEDTSSKHLAISNMLVSATKGSTNEGKEAAMYAYFKDADFDNAIIMADSLRQEKKSKNIDWLILLSRLGLGLSVADELKKDKWLKDAVYKSKTEKLQQKLEKQAFKKNLLNIIPLSFLGDDTELAVFKRDFRDALHNGQINKAQAIAMQLKTLDATSNFNENTALNRNIQIDACSDKEVPFTSSLENVLSSLGTRKIINKTATLDTCFFNNKTRANLIKELENLILTNADLPLLQALYYHKIGVLYFQDENDKLAIENYEQALKSRELLLEKNDTSIIKCYRNIGECYYYLGEKDKALSKLNTALTLAISNEETPSTLFANIYHLLGRLKEKKGDVHMSKIYLENAISKYAEENKLSQIAIAYNELVFLLADKMKSPEAAKTKAKAALNILKDEKLNLQAAVYHNYAFAYEMNEQLDSAIFCYEKAISINNKLNVEWKTMKSQINLIGVYKRKGDFEKAKASADIVENFYLKEENSTNKFQQLALVYDNLGDVKKEEKQFKEALSYYNKSLEYTEAWDEWGRLATLQSRTTLYEAMNNIDLALKGYQEMDGLINEIRFSLVEESKYQFVKKSKPIYESAIQLNEKLYKKNNDLNYIKKALYYAEKSKSVILFDAINKANVYDENQKETKFTTLFQEDLDFAKIQQELINEEQTIVEYFVGKEAIYAFVVNSVSINLVALPLTKNELEKNVKAYNKCLSDAKIKGFVESAYYLYEHLIQPLNIAKGQELIIVPDNIIGKLSFDALLTSKNVKNKADFKDMDYLLKSHSISYDYSILLKQERAKYKKQKDFKYSTALFAPAFRDDLRINLEEKELSFSALPENKKEIESINQQIGSKGITYYAEEASKSNFKEIISNTAVIHLSTHGYYAQSYPDLSFILFNTPENNIESLPKEALSLKEISKQTLQNDLIVLSACQTAQGKLQEGEGIMSISRAFYYAGAESVVSSLWNVNSNRTQELMVLFYKHLNNKMEKNKALQKAKLEYIKQGNEVHPYYWAGFIPFGNMNAIEL